MRPAAAVLSAALLLLSPAAAAAEDPAAARTPANALSLNVLSVIVDFARGAGLPFELEYERALGTRLSLYVAPRFTWISNELTSGIGLGASVGARYYAFHGPALAGLWVGADVGTDFRSERANGTDVTITGFDGVLGRMLVGYNLLLGPLYVSPGAGIEYRWPELPTYHLRLALGYAF